MSTRHGKRAHPMNTWTRLIALILGGLVGLSSTAHAQAPSRDSGRGTVMWTIAGAGGGFGVGLWAGLTKFDDAINSDRKVWTSAAVGAAVGAVGGYLIGRARAGRSRSNPSSTIPVPRPALSLVPSFDHCDRVSGQTGGTSRSFSFQSVTCMNRVAFVRPGSTRLPSAIPLPVEAPSR